MIPANAVKTVASTQTIRARPGGQPRYSASPPQTPAIIRLFCERHSFINQVASRGNFRFGRPMKK